MKEEILNIITMQDILSKYGIKTNRTMFSCPFHGTDKHPSAKAYKNSFYCFNCGKTGDLIQFVQYYFNLDFKESMQKINEDFNLGLDTNFKIDYTKIKEIENKRKEKEIKKKNIDSNLRTICSNYCENQNKIKRISEQINYFNWEQKVSEKSKLEELNELLNYEFEYHLQKRASIN